MPFTAPRLAVFPGFILWSTQLRLSSPEKLARGIGKMPAEQPADLLRLSGWNEAKLVVLTRGPMQSIEAATSSSKGTSPSGRTPYNTGTRDRAARASFRKPRTHGRFPRHRG
jgi:hypothetical protein